MIYKAVNNN